MNSFRQVAWPEWGFHEAKKLRLDYRPDALLTSIEIEMENDNYGMSGAEHLLNQVPFNNWIVKPEGSLRDNGFELVSALPLPLDDAIRSLSQLYPLFENVSFTFRAGVHAHFNVQNLTREQYMRICIGYYLREPSVYTRVAMGRDESVFCVPWSKSSAHVRSVYDAYAAEDDSSFANAIASSPKYSGLNLRATSIYGTVEFRHLTTPANCTSVEAVNTIVEYVRMCADIVTSATAASWDGIPLLTYADALIRDSNRMVSPEHLASVYSMLVSSAPVDALAEGMTNPTTMRVFPYLRKLLTTKVHDKRRRDRILSSSSSPRRMSVDEVRSAVDTMLAYSEAGRMTARMTAPPLPARRVRYYAGTSAEAGHNNRIRPISQQVFIDAGNGEIRSVTLPAPPRNAGMASQYLSLSDAIWAEREPTDAELEQGDWDDAVDFDEFNEDDSEEDR